MSEVEVKEVFQRLLEDAPPMSRSADDMIGTARGSQIRRRGLLGTGAAALAVVAVTTASAMFAQQPAGVGPAEGVPSASPVPSTVVLPVTIPPVHLRFGPTWIPQGWAEHGRMAWFAGREGDGEVGPSRTWAPTTARVAHGDLKGTRFELWSRRARESDPGPGEGDAVVDINGRPGVVVRDGGRVRSIEWRADADTLLTLKQWEYELSEQEMVRIARSVAPDPGLFTTPLSLGWIPDWFAPAGVEFVGRSPDSWHARLDLAPRVPPTLSPLAGKQDATPTITVAIGTETLAPQGGEPVTVGGRPARYVVAKVADGMIDLPYLVVELGGTGGLLLTVSSFYTPREQLVQIAQGAAHDPAADLSWIGRR